MKLKKKTAMILSFSVGTLLFATTALAEVTTKSGYDEIKDALKYTAESCSEKLSNYTLVSSFVLKDNNEVISFFDQTAKYDTRKGARETTASSLDYKGDKFEGYTYLDKSTVINYDSGSNSYIVTENHQMNNIAAFTNPFKEKGTDDLEKIADALVGNLKDYVVIDVKADGSKELTGSLSESQIPALINAVTSFQFKNHFGGYYAARLGVYGEKAPKMVSDIYVKDVKGNMVVDKNGLIQSILGTGTLSGKDEKGKEHSLTFELLEKLNNVNSTVVDKPDLTGKKVQKAEKGVSMNRPEAAKFAGQFKGDIVIEKDGKLEKIGERIVDIEKSTENFIAGRYHEEYRKGYEKFSVTRKDFKFEAVFDSSNPYQGIFKYTNSAGKSIDCNLSLSIPGLKFYLFIPDSSEQPKGVIITGEMNKVFD